MSGGVDSSVAAALLLADGPRGRRGHPEAVGRRVRHRAAARWPTSTTPAGSPTQLGIDHHVFNFGDDFDAPRGRALRAPTTPPGARPTRASSATATSSSTRCCGGPTGSASTRWPPATTPGSSARRRRRGGWPRGADRGQGPVLRAAHARPGRSWRGCCCPVGELTKAEVRAVAAGARACAPPPSPTARTSASSPATDGRRRFLGDRIPLHPGPGGRRRRRRSARCRGGAGDGRPAPGPRASPAAPSPATWSTSTWPPRPSTVGPEPDLRVAGQPVAEVGGRRPSATPPGWCGR